MNSRKAVPACLLAVLLVTTGAAALDQELTGVPQANRKTVGVSLPTVLSPELAAVAVAQGSTPVENPSTAVRYYAYLNDQPNMLPALGSNVEASKTEPDKNT